MADSLPIIDFGFEDLRQRMANFTDRFDEFIAQGRKRVLEERNQFRINVAELRGEPLLSASSSFYSLMLYRGSASTKKGHRNPCSKNGNTCSISPQGSRRNI